ncbi:hypothetical protein ACQR1V_15295 [Bradyrhizobium oligotrophicum]|uniref:hypothetical protein n=1 Tax=Bradyrhizobium oligotrophicum TaxID=44255 RepID=UPI003EBE3733
MRKMILIGAMVLASATVAQAEGTRSLSLSSNDVGARAPRPTYVQQAGEVTVTPAPVPAVAAQIQPIVPPAAPPVAPAAPAAVPSPPQPAATAAPAPQPGSVQRSSRRSTSARSDRTRRKGWTEARIVRELHRHGIYW